MKNYLLFIVLLLTFSPGRASTSITSSSVSGEWTLSGSPYLVYNNITIDAGSTLMIDPGVEVIFEGQYALTVNGIIYASGTASQYILFHINDTTGFSDSGSAGGWNGILFNTYTGTDTSVFQYCNLCDMKNGGVVFSFRNNTIKYCNFYHNRVQVLAANNSAGVNMEIGYCNFYNNSMGYGQMTAFSGGNFYIHNCNMFNNSGEDMIYTSYANVNIISNAIYQNNQPDTSNGAPVEMWYSNVVLNNNMVYENATLDDGAISEWYSQVDINMNYICNNKVTIGFTGSSACGELQGGGGIRLDNDGDSYYHMNLVRNNIIANNYTAFEGAAVYVMGSNAKIFNNQIVNNFTDYSGSGAINIFDNSTVGGTYVWIKNNLFYHNVSTGPSGGLDTIDLAVFNVDSLGFDHNYIQNTFSADGVLYGGTTACYSYALGDTATNIIGSTSQMIHPTDSASVTESALTADFRIIPGSVLINAGDTTACSPGAYDFWGNPRFYASSGSMVDIGANEFNPTEAGPTIVGNLNASKSVVQIYPNPAINECTFTKTDGFGTGSKVAIYDINGRLVNTSLLFSNSTTISLAGFTPGVYTCNIMINEQVEAVEKLTVVK